MVIAVAHGLKEVIKGKNKNEPLIVHLNSIELKLDATYD